MGRIQIFKIELFDRWSDASLKLAGGRTLDEEFYLEIDELVLSMDLSQALDLASAAKNAALRAGVKSGPVYQRKIGVDAGSAWNLEIGIASDLLIYVEAAGATISCDEAQGDRLLADLGRFGADVHFVSSLSPLAPRRGLGIALAQGPPGPTETNVVPGLRGAYPWESGGWKW